MNDLPPSLTWIRDDSGALRAAGLWRTRRCYEGAGAWLEVEGRRLANFGSNDYLGLACDERVRRAAAQAIHERWGAAASPLLTGRTPAHTALEADLARFEGTEAALVFSSGYAANLGTLTALAGPGDVVFCDRLNHASLIDGCRLSRARMRVYRHRDVGQLERLLHREKGRRRFLVTDAVFSMDGDLAPLDALVDLADRYDATLIVDEAHGTGVFGERGRGVAEYLGVESRVAVRAGTLSKALGSSGGFVAGSRELVDWLANQARSYVYSTAPPPAVCAAASAALRVVQDEPERRRRLLESASRLRALLADAGIEVGGEKGPIVPVVVGDPEGAVACAAALEQRGFLVPAIRAPSVPRGTDRLRVSLSADHDVKTVEDLAAELARQVRRRIAAR
jgi:8-amino-7-oxononanoate synthase